MIAPVLCHTAEDIWQYLPYARPTKSVFQGGWVKVSPEWQDQALGEKWHKLTELRSQVYTLLENARNAKLIGSSLEAKVFINIHNPDLLPLITSVAEEMRYILIVSQVELQVELQVEIPAELTAVTNAVQFQSSSDNYSLVVTHAEHEKCPRCWNYAVLSEEKGICDRCHLALAGEF